MDRRKFLTLAALTPPAALAAEEGRKDAPYEAWWKQVESPEDFSAHSGEGNLTLKVRLLFPPEDKVTEIADKDGTITGYSFEGKKLPERYWRGQSLLRKFELDWDGKAVAIDPRFWSDLVGFVIQDSKTDIASLDQKHVAAFLDFAASLQQPQISLSEDKGTALIEWERSEECDGRAMIRWMVSRGGTVLRHRTAGGGC